MFIFHDLVQICILPGDTSFCVCVWGGGGGGGEGVVGVSVIANITYNCIACE